jgi:hypothetical protein
METIAYGLFRDRATAEAAVEGLAQGESAEVLRTAIYVGEIDDAEVKGAGTRSRSYALLGGLVAAAIGGVLGAIFISELLGIRPIATGVMAALVAGALGALLGSLAGVAIPRPEIDALSREVAAGKILVTVDVQSQRVGEELRAQLVKLGALRAGLLSGSGFEATLQAGLRSRSGTS